jgi:signal transduction histidine kinase
MVALIALSADVAARDRLILAAVLVATGAAGVGVALLVRRYMSGRSLRAQLVVAGLTALAVLTANIAAAASLMFISTHNLNLLVVLCAYTLATTIGPAWLIGLGLSRRIGAIEAAARRIAGGELTARVPVEGSGEVASLAAEFNRMARELETANARRDRIERSRRDLFAAISHDLRTPLASVRVAVEALLDGVVDDDATRQRYLHAASSEVQRLSVLIDDLFELTTLDSGELRLRTEQLRVEDIVSDAIDSFRPQVERAGIRLEFEPGETPPVAVDPNRLTRVVLNLLQNAVRHTPSDGTITLQTVATPGGAQVVVADTGDGIAVEDLPHVFERFWRADRARTRDGAGSGLGLAIARGIVEAHGGLIAVESAPGQGTTFRVSLPAVT